ncbi:hypothetical protein C2G38_2155336 [Gigaspora rosea]|uniref:Uncharacterized protein n=1 Tax=Gigaspora rosea TaxID=44941 RepID=A0A397W7Y7_9GLOM|nr:hypothetical protein C2G38_2155336 [Gigaspora rosea]
MNPEVPEERKYIEELIQEYIYLSEELDYDVRYEVKGKDIYDREEIKEPPVEEYERRYIQDEYRSEITIIIQKQVPTAALFEFKPYNHKYNYEIPIRFLRNITKDYINLQDSNQENNVVEQILSKEELNIKLQGLLDQIKIQIQILQEQLTLEEAYKNHKYTKAYLNRTLLTLEGAWNIQENDQATPIIFPNTGLTQATQNYLLQHYQQLYSEITTPRRNPRGYLQRIGTPIIIEAIGIDYQLKSLMPDKKTRTYYIRKIILLLENYRTEIVKELSTLETPRLKEYYKTALIFISVNQGILEERIKEFSIQSIEGENNLMNEEQNRTLKELRKFRFNWQPISTPTRKKKTKRYPRDKDILESRELIQITDDIWKTINDLINRINPTNNSRLGAILLMLEGAKSIAREFYPHVLEYDKQRPNKIPAHILMRTQTLFPELTGRALVKEQEKQRNIYNNFLDNTQAQIEGIKKRLLAESLEFCKILKTTQKQEKQNSITEIITTSSQYYHSDSTI